MDTTHMVSKRIEQALNQLQRELRREGRTLPTETFTVTTGDSITVEAASKAETQPRPVAEDEPEVRGVFTYGVMDGLPVGNYEPAKDAQHVSQEDDFRAYPERSAFASSEFPSQETFDVDADDESGVRDE